MKNRDHKLEFIELLLYCSDRKFSKLFMRQDGVKTSIQEILQQFTILDHLSQQCISIVRENMVVVAEGIPTFFYCTAVSSCCSPNMNVQDVRLIQFHE